MLIGMLSARVSSDIYSYAVVYAVVAKCTVHILLQYDSRADHGSTVMQFAGREHVPQLQQALQPMRIILEEQPYLGGTDPNFADLAVAGNFAV